MAREQYSVAQVWLHWIIAVLILFQYLSGDSASHHVHTVIEGKVRWGQLNLGANYHMIMGTVVLALASARLCLRLVLGTPPHVPGGPNWSHLLAKWVQEGLYLMIFLVPITGFIGTITFANFWLGTHELAKTILLVLVLLHIAGALYQIFVNKQGSFKRMTRFRK